MQVHQYLADAFGIATGGKLGRWGSNGSGAECGNGFDGGESAGVDLSSSCGRVYGEGAEWLSCWSGSINSNVVIVYYPDKWTCMADVPRGDNHVDELVSKELQRE